MAGEARAVVLATLGAALAGCGGPPKWTVVAALDRVVLSAWGPSETEAIVVGGGLGNGANGVAFHLKDGRWKRVDLDSTDTMWWVFGFSGSDAWFVGERGAVYRYDGVAAVRMATPTTATLFGVWGASPGEIWAVGGTPQAGGPNDVILRFDGSAWTRVASPEPLGVAYFKVWGSARDDVFIVGQGGVLFHYDGTAWSRRTSPTRSTLLTVAGNGPTGVLAVGGPPPAFLEYDGAAWNVRDPVGVASGLTGVSMSAKGAAFVVGLAGVKWRREAGKWIDESDQDPLQDLHGVWTAPDGSALAAGGNFVAAGGPGATRKGVVAYFGTRPPPAIR